jgi:hypothetical protein
MRVKRSSILAPASKVSPSVSMFEQLESRCLMSVTPAALSPTGVALKASSYNLATFTTTDSPVKAANYTATVSFGDGSSGAGKVKFAKGVFSVSATHRYANPGILSAVVTIHDKVDGTSQSVTDSVAIDPSHSGNGLTNVKGSRAQYFQLAFTGAWRAKGTNYTNGKLTATRINDRADINWSGNIDSASVVGAFALNSEQFGFLPGTSGGSYQNLFSINGNGSSVTGGVGATAMPATYRLARTGDDGNVFSSDPLNNKDFRDHMITYQIKGIPGQPAGEKTYVVFWEDTPGVTSDFDFNDLIVEVTLNGTGPTA